MKIKHRISNNWESNQSKIMQKHGFSVEGFDSIEIEENNVYFEIKPYLDKWNAMDIRYPEFTKKEIKDSLLSAKNGSHNHGYPMPDDDLGYLNLTYDLTNYCESCGIGLKQKDSFRIKNTPKEGKKRMFQLIWVNDEIFVDTSLFNEVFKPLGIKSKKVLKYKKEIAFENVVQLVIPETEENLNLKDNPKEDCCECNNWKYQPMPQGFYPNYLNTIAPIFKSKEYFGSGASAFKRIFIVKELRDKLIELKIEKINWYVPTK
ncbi:hypothetical protein [Aquimarina sp. 2201CG14-23]|jgi:hypothetical protein|uniref:hypothetical protein n=1 Tax=Aquimarina mycalae TaxID=3040073 RepID=UPI00247804BE|nr:hypothetical protein [Aquimarina sp. 2201CG14-23]MDH7447549.1 hypothetical protein [Aquimarina sp. 2201CG14-23]